MSRIPDSILVILIIFTVIGDSLVFAAVGTFGNGRAGNPFIFPLVRAKRGNQWNDTTSTFTIKEAYGLYLVGLSVGVPGGTQGDYTMVLSRQRYAGISRTSRAHSNSDMIGRDIIMELYAAETVHISNGYQVQVGTSLDTSVTIFSVSETMVHRLVAFSVARHDTLSGSANPLPFDEIIYNSGFYFNTISNIFTAPSSGVYYFCFSVGLVPRGTARFTLYKNEEPFVNIFRESTTHTGTDTIGRSVIMELNEDDTVHIGNPAGYTARSSVLKETSFCGFKYEPKHGNQVRYDNMRISKVLLP